LGEMSRGGNESIESLTSLIGWLKKFGEDSSDLIKYVLNSRPVDQTNTVNVIKRVVESCDKKVNLIYRLRQAFADYTGKRL